MGAFLSAEWQNVVMLNYAVNPSLLAPYVPPGTELDSLNGTTYLSVVGLLFRKTRVLGIPVPVYGNFEEVNLRFYVRRRVGSDWRPGVAFVKEVVPRKAIAAVARMCYNEPCVAMPMTHRIKTEKGAIGTNRTIEYRWQSQRWNSLQARAVGEPQSLVAGSREEFITGRNWGYVAQRNNKTLEYQLQHQPWRVWQAKDAALDCDVAGLYGPQFSQPLGHTPNSAFIADGSRVHLTTGKTF